MSIQKKKVVTAATAFVFICSLFINFFQNSVQAFEHPGIYQDIKVGLVSMAAPTMTATLQGEYSFGGKTIPGGSVINISASNGLVNINGSEYSEVNFLPSASENLITLTNGVKTYRYYGKLSFKVSSGKILPINSLDIETYLKGVVGLEMSDYFPLEALKAQAVAARTYSLSKLGAERAKGYDIDDTISYQVYGGYFSTYKNVIKAVEDTRGIVLVHNDQLVETLYSASNGGYTEASQNVWFTALPYFTAKPDSFDSEIWPGGGNRTFTAEQIDALLKSRGQISGSDKFMRIDLGSITSFASGRISNLNYEYEDSAGTLKVKSVRKEGARTFLGLPSALYTVSYDSGTGIYTFRGKGNGHGIGMSQIGAKNRAISGQSFIQILQFYYQDSYIVNLTPTAKLSTVSIDRAAVQIGSGAVITAQGSGGSGQYLYKFMIQSNSQSVVDTGYIQGSTYNIVPSKTGEYNVTVFIKDKLSSKAFDEKKDISFIVYTQTSIASFTASSTNTAIGQNVDFSAAASGGSGQYTYKYAVLRDGSKVAETDYAASGKYSYIPRDGGNYQVQVFVKDILSSIHNDSRSLSFMVSAPKPDPVTVSRLPVKKGMKGSDVQNIQTALNKLGYSVGKADGIFGNMTYNALIRFQKNNKLGATGVVDVATLSIINKIMASSTSPAIPPAAVTDPRANPVAVSRLPIKKGMRGKDVQSIQTALNNLGYSVGRADGVFGNITYNAVVRFQKNNRLNATGIVDAATLNSINSSLKTRFGSR